MQFFTISESSQARLNCRAKQKKHNRREFYKSKAICKKKLPCRKTNITQIHDVNKRRISVTAGDFLQSEAIYKKLPAEKQI